MNSHMSSVLAAIAGMSMSNTYVFRRGTADPFVVESARRGDKRVKRKRGPFNKRKPRSTGAQGGRKK